MPATGPEILARFRRRMDSSRLIGVVDEVAVNLRDLQYVVALAETGHFGEAT